VEVQHKLIINKSQDQVFEFVADNFPNEYPNWAPEINKTQSLTNGIMKMGYKLKQIRKENDELLESVLTITQYQPKTYFSYESMSDPTVSYFQFENYNDCKTELTYRFRLNDIELSMRPFGKLIKAAILDGVTQSLNNIKCLLETSKQVAPSA